MSRQELKMSEALVVAVKALQQYAGTPRRLPEGTYSATFYDHGDTAARALAQISRLLEEAGYRGDGDAEGNVR